MNSERDKITMTVILLAGKILLSSGAEVSRVEDTMRRMAISMGYYNSQGYVINFSLSEDHDTRIVRINKNITNLLKIFQVNTISRQLSSNTLSIYEAHRLLQNIDRTSLSSPLWQKVIAAGIISLSFLYLLNGEWINVPITLLAGAIGYLIVEYMQSKSLTMFIPEFVGSFILGSIVILGSQMIHTYESLGPTMIASVMPIVPGVVITTAIQDLFSRHMLMFTAKFLEALVIAFAIGSGIAIAYLIY
ncbi:threonine/serine exporter [Staphylococcus arlettae]|uniref:threonine/serine exporter family protein n=1 Tax=Staphylococcus arlettae TaxID=29378 RepID=UPI0010716770|nr:threonine/serine exporter family protein [Staphylococcus arlettae]MBF0738457.1 threonine/serine exporter family protein [Staphylococcus arlettae]MBK3720130.1 Inner membrane protein YjjP [Staphylococcus arlettae]TFU46156.1 threonine/serine exporter [Staphylococcus arlettae]